MTEKLEPCPFCGRPEVVPTRVELPFYSWHIWCPSCRSCGPTNGQKREAIRLWNTRKQKEPTK